MKTLGEAVAAGKHPKTWKFKFPGNYTVTCKIVSARHKKLENAEGMFYGFGPVATLDQSEKHATIFFSAGMTTARFLHVYFHEMGHSQIEWSGAYHNDLMELLEAK